MNDDLRNMHEKNISPGFTENNSNIHNGAEPASKEPVVSSERAGKASSFTLKIEDDDPYFYRDLSSEAENGKINKEILKEQERAFYEAENKRNHPEKKQVNVRHSKTVGKKRRHKKTSGCMTKLLVGVAVVVCASILSFFIMSCANDLLGLFKSEEEVIVKIPEGASTQEIAEILKENNLIDQPYFFTMFSKLRKYDGDYQSGTFSLKSKDGYEGMINIMQYVEESAETVRITFTEGKTIEEIGQLLEENDVCGKDVFLAVMKSDDFDYDFADEIPMTESRYYKYEGYVFPDTYDFFIGENVESVAKKFFDNFQVKFTEEYKARAAEIGMTMDEVIRLASIVQKEAGTIEEMNGVASVFANRLKSSTYPSLQSDPTVFYYRDYILPHIADQSESVKEAYNDAYSTYNCVGLPAGAICNPGTDAIEAVLYHDETPYYFFVTDKEGNYYYASTYAEHQANCAKAGVTSSY